LESVKNKNAFTILEMLIVIIVVTIITSTMLVNINQFNQKHSLNQIAKQFGANFNMMQSQSIMRTCNSHIEVYQTEYKIIICDEHYKTETLPSNITAKTKFTSNISVNKNGNLRFGAGRVIFTSQDFEKQIIFSIGEGRYRIE
jgi:type II secretory pathway pseudopilin PulG